MTQPVRDAGPLVPAVPPPLPTGPSEPSTAGTVKDETAQVGRAAVDAGRSVAGTAADQAGQVVGEARDQARNLLGEARDQVAEQAGAGQQKAVEGIRALAEELHRMAEGAEGGTAADLAQQAAGRLDDAADWIGQRDPGGLLDEVRGLARRRPGAFLVGAAVAGLLAGRLTRGVVDDKRSGEGPGRSPVPTGAAGRPTYEQQTYAAPTHGAPADPAAGIGVPAPTAPVPYAAPVVQPGVAPAPTPVHPSVADGTRDSRTVGEYVEELARQENAPGIERRP